MIWSVVFALWGVVVIGFNRWVAKILLDMSWFEMDEDRWLPWFRVIAVVAGVGFVVVGVAYAITGEPMFPSSPSATGRS
jgi:fatty acid desaturase